ncbi:MAG: integrase arm-type DNA-binding domain-containing protein [Proteobacteria bacterium]|nr:integrase arm-type DNA-binding domain-containing protein [Pseudomonadota bacterium]
MQTKQKTKLKLTGAVIRGLKPKADGKRETYWDSAYSGLCLRVGNRDKTWAYFYRFDGKQRNHRIGKYALGRADHTDRAAAIAAADVIQEKIERGIDPKGDIKPIEPKPTTKNPNAFKRRVKQFLKLYENKVKLSTHRQATRLLTGPYVESLAHTSVSKIKRSQLVELLEGMADTPVQANRLQAYLSKFFDWCWDHEYCEPSPMVRLSKRFKETSRTRNLDKEAIKQLWKGCKELGYPLGDWCLFTLATGQRPGECRNLNRNDVVKDVWLVEGGDPKNSERHRIPLPKIARDIIKSAPIQDGPYIFSTTAGEKPFTQGGKPYNLLYETIGLDKPWRPHDLRRTFQTIASEELNIDQSLLGAICNQMSVAKPGVANVYNQAQWIKQKRKALKQWNEWILEAVK